MSLYLSTGKRVLLVTHNVVMKQKFSYLNVRECCKYAFPAHYSNWVRAPKYTMTYQSNVAKNISTILYGGVKVLVFCIIHCTHYPICVTERSAGLVNVSVNIKLKFVCDNFSGVSTLNNQ